MYGTISFSNGSPKAAPQFAVEAARARKAESILQRHGRTLLATVCAVLGSLSLGATVGYTSPAIPNLNSHPNHFHLTTTQVSWVAGIIALGGILGEPVGGLLIDRYGRRMTLILITVPFAFGWILVGVAPNVLFMYVGRFLTGFCSGMVDIAAPVYIAEISEKSVRGFMGSCHELATNMGYLFAFAFGIVLPWNWLALACAFIPAVMLGALIVLAPESPRWLLMHGHSEECVQVLTWLRGPRVDIGPELTSMKNNLRDSGSSTMRWKELGHPSILKPLGIVAVLMFCQQFSGYGAIPEYLVAIFESTGTAWNPYTLTAIVGVMGVIANLISALIVDRTGRRVMLMTSASIMTVSMATMGAFFIAKTFAHGFDVVSSFHWVPLIAMMTYNFGVALGLGPIPFYLASELFPLRARGMAGGISISLVWAFMFITSFAFPHLIDLFHEYVVYSVLTFFTLLGVLVAYYVVPETKGKSLEEIEAEFKK